MVKRPRTSLRILGALSVLSFFTVRDEVVVLRLVVVLRGAAFARSFCSAIIYLHTSTLINPVKQ